MERGGQGERVQACVRVPEERAKATEEERERKNEGRVVMAVRETESERKWDTEGGRERERDSRREKQRVRASERLT